MPALIKSALQRIQEAVEAARAGRGVQHLPADALYEAWKSPVNSADLLNLQEVGQGDITHSPLAEWLRSQNVGVRLEGPPAFNNSRHYDATGGRQSFDMPLYWYDAGAEPDSLRWLLSNLPDQIKGRLHLDDPNMNEPVVRGAYGYVNGSEGGGQTLSNEEMLKASGRTWAELSRDPNLRLQSNLSYAVPRGSTWHAKPLVKAKKSGGSV